MGKLFGVQGNVSFYAGKRFLKPIELDSVFELGFAHDANVGSQHAKMLQDQVDGFV
ncbi:hypothetical protein BH10PSE6_BH10PSE6_11140 [soil metagenome]